jgi:RNA polymerase sigma factor (sigma-70 family)
MPKASAARGVVSFFEANPDLLLPFREGRHDVLDKVYRAHVRSVERCLHGLARRHGAQELVQRGALADLLQEIFVRAFSEGARASFDGVRSFGSYLNAIARNCFIDALRAAGREVLNPTDELEPFDEEAEPAYYAEPAVRAAVSEYLSALTPPLDGVYAQRFVLGNSQEEACLALGLSRRQLRTEEQRLRVGLRKALQRLGILRDDMRSGPMKFRPSR